MKIAIDARSIGLKICGVSRVALCEIKALAALDRDNQYIVYTDVLDSIPGISKKNFNVVRTDCNRMNAFHDIRFSRFLKRDNPEVLHVMHSWLPFGIPAKIKKIVTIHDIFTVTDPDFFAKRQPLHHVLREYFRLITRLTIQRADVIVTVSGYCRKEIQRNFDTMGKRLEIVYQAPGITLTLYPERGCRRLVKGYFFYLGNFRSYKNVPTLIRGYDTFIRKTGADVDLVIAGNDDCYDILTLAEELGISKRLHLFIKPDDQMIANLYSHALAFVFPSNHEGFGIPPLEAMSFNVPVIISDADALVETSGNAALIFERGSPEDLAAKLEMLCADEGLRAGLINKGVNCVKSYSWSKSAEKLMKIYKC